MASALSSWRPSAGLTCIERYGRFEILGRIGRGGMAEILLARERALAGSTRHLVIKRVLPDISDNQEMLHMFLDEARVVMGLAHPNLCQIYEVGQQDDAWFIAMEWVNGATLHHLIKRAVHAEDFDLSVLAKVISLSAEALHHAHTARDADGRPLHLVHRDVSPHNIMVAYDGRVKLLDFGIAKSTKSTHQTEAGVVKGKVCYMAPEQWMCAPLDARTDVFALGACLFEALTGRIVFKRETQSEVMRAVLKEGAPSLLDVAPHIPPALAEITARALSFHADDRFQSALELSEALEHYLASLSAPLPAAKIAAYVRRLFRNEVELGPLLERSVRAAHLPAAPVLLPPLPPSLLGVPKITPSMMGLDEPNASLAPLDPFASLPMGIELAPPAPSFQPDDYSNADDLTQSTERPVTEPPLVDLIGPSLPDNDVQPALDVALRSVEGEARPALRTVSMRARRGLRWALIAVPSAALVLLGLSLAVPPRDGSHPTAGAAASAHKATHAADPAASLPSDGLRIPEIVSVPPAAPEPATVPRVKPAHDTKANGRLSINTRPWSTVYLGSRVLGTTPLANVAVPRGALMLKLVDRDGNVHLRKIARSRKPERSAFFDLPLAKK